MIITTHEAHIGTQKSLCQTSCMEMVNRSPFFPSASLVPSVLSRAKEVLDFKVIYIGV